jgi:hypothetical protein
MYTVVGSFWQCTIKCSNVHMSGRRGEKFSSSLSLRRSEWCMWHIKRALIKGCRRLGALVVGCAGTLYASGGNWHVNTARSSAGALSKRVYVILRCRVLNKPNGKKHRPQEWWHSLMCQQSLPVATCWLDVPALTASGCSLSIAG